MTKGRRKRVGDFSVDDKVVVKNIGTTDKYIIERFPSRRMVVLKALNPSSEFPSSVTVSLVDIEKDG